MKSLMLHMAATALAANRSTPSLAGTDLVANLTVYNAEIMYAGGIAAVDYTDEVQMAADTAGLRVVGRVKEYVDNTADGKSATVERGIFRFTNSSTYPIPRSNIGMPCYVEDDNIVAGFSTNLVSAGLVHDVDSTGVWVDMRPSALAMAWALRPVKRVSKTDDYTVTAAIAFEGRSYFDCDKASIMEITLPTAVGGMKVGVKRISATAAHDVTIQAATGDTIEASDATCAAGKQIDNTYDAVGHILWLQAMDDTAWKVVPPFPPDFALAWVKNDA